jgi:hypothetical protein
MLEKLKWKGQLVSVQPRIRLQRSFDQRSHTYQGFALRVNGQIADKSALFAVGIGKATQAKYAFNVGDTVEGFCLPVAQSNLDSVEYYEVSGLQILNQTIEQAPNPPPWHGVPPPIETYRERGHRRLAQKTFEAKCFSCLWAADMAVEMIIDQWNPTNVRYRRETFCYGPKSCPLYVAGPTRRVPGRKGMTWVEEDWVDDQETSHRTPDD